MRPGLSLDWEGTEPCGTRFAESQTVEAVIIRPRVYIVPLAIMRRDEGQQPLQATELQPYIVFIASVWSPDRRAHATSLFIYSEFISVRLDRSEPFCKIHALAILLYSIPEIDSVYVWRASMCCL